MVALLKKVLLTAIALTLLVIVQRAFGTTAAFVVAGACFLVYILAITVAQMRAEEEDDDAQR